MKKLPLSITTFEKIRDPKENYLYVDKTDTAYELITSSSYNFLSRPRRFGKSLFLDTLSDIFQAKKELFKGLYIYDKWDWSVSYPVINIDFNSGDFRTEAGVEHRIFDIIRRNQDLLYVECKDTEDISSCFTELIINTYEKHNQKVVILVDEYDKPILDNITNPEMAAKATEMLKIFYSVIKGLDRYIKFVFITGVSKFSKVSLFSGLNNLNDITINQTYSTICGYTQNDVETTFGEHLKGQDFEKIKKWYNGYKWLGEGVYNPFDILLFINNNFVYENYWFSTGTPTFLMKLIEKNNYFLPNLEHIIKDKDMLNSFDVDNIELETLLWQTGYLTIKESYESMKGRRYRLDIPNLEVQISLMGRISSHISKITNSELKEEKIYEALITSNFTQLEKTFKALFASIPYYMFNNNKMYNYEGYFVSVFYAYIKALGVDVECEVPTSKGRLDMAIKLEKSIVIIEFKVDDETALEQIEDMKYYEMFLDDERDVYLVGIEFSKKERNIVDLKSVLIEKI